MDYRIVVPSMGRPTCVPRLRKILGTFSMVLHPRDRQAYEAVGLDGLDVKYQPEGVVGIAAVREFGQHAWPEPWIVQVEDDLTGIVSLVGMRPRTYTDPEVTHAILGNMVRLCDDIGALAFVFNQSPNVSFFNPADPIKIGPGGLLSASFGLHQKARVHFDSNLKTGEDFDATLQFEKEHKWFVRDRRFVFLHSHYKDAGGAQAYRTKNQQDKDLAYLEKKWGKAVVAKRTQREQVSR